jgi:endonuclease G
MLMKSALHTFGRNVFLVLATAALCVSQMVPAAPVSAPQKQRGEDFLLEIPVCGARFGESDHEVHEYTAFTLCYRESYELAEWVAYELTRKELAVITSRSNDFRIDPSISTGSAAPRDYYKSGYDRGHLAPAADMRFNPIAMSESFFMSNMAPQTASLNRGIWKYAEDATRRLAETYGRVWVVSGPVLDRTDFKTIGENNVAVPDYFFKALLFPVDGGIGFSALSFIMPNENPGKRYTDYRVSIDEIEARTGLDLFSALPDDIEAIVEAIIESY